MVKVRLKTAPTLADVERLRVAERVLQELMRGMHPSAACHAPLYAAIATVRACAIDWSGDPAIWTEKSTADQMPGARRDGLSRQGGGV